MGWSSGLVGLWGMEEAGGNSRLDSSGAGNHLTEDNGSIPRSSTYKRGTYSAGEFSTSFLIRTDANLSSTFPGKNGGSNTAFSIGFWFYIPATPGAATMQLITKGSGKIEAWWADGDPATFAIYVGGKQITLSGVNLDTWHHVAMTYDGTTLNGYLDAVAGTPQTSVGAYTSTSDFVVGCFDPSVDSYPWEGYIDELFVYDRALNRSEIKHILTHGLAELMADNLLGHKVTNIEGFEHGDLETIVVDSGGTGGLTYNGTPLPSIVTTRHYSHASSLKVNPSAVDANYVTVPAAYGADGQADTTEQNFGYVSVRIWIETLPSVTNRILSCMTSTTTQQIWVELTSSGTLTLRGTAAGSPTTLSTGRWYEIAVKCFANPDEQELKIDGVTEVVAATAINAWHKVALGRRTTVAAGTHPVIYYDNLIVELSDTETEVWWPDSSWLIGDQHPAGVGNYDNWPNIYPTGNDLFESVDEATPDNDTSYVYNPNSVGTKATVQMESLSSAGINPLEVVAVKHMVMVKPDVASGSGNAKLLLRSNTTDDETDGGTFSWTGKYYHLAKVHMTDPATDAQWLEAAVSDMELGLTDNHATNDYRVTMIAAQVLYDRDDVLSKLALTASPQDILIDTPRRRRRVVVVG